VRWGPDKLPIIRHQAADHRAFTNSPEELKRHFDVQAKRGVLPADTDVVLEAADASRCDVRTHVGSGVRVVVASGMIDHCEDLEVVRIRTLSDGEDGQPTWVVQTYPSLKFHEQDLADVFDSSRAPR